MPNSTKRVTQRFCKDEVLFVHILDEIVAAGFDVFSVCQSVDGVWHAWIRLTDDSYRDALDDAVKRGIDAKARADQAGRANLLG